MSLDQEIKDRSAEVHSDGYSMSIGEIVNLYRDGELDIHPEFQRFYRWSPEQKSRLIESILLGIPLPSIFVSQRDDGVWDVVDGLQRLSTILELMGELRDEDGNRLPALELTRTKYLPSLEGMRWKGKNPDVTIGSTNQLIIRRSKIDVKIILRESSSDTKYELFQRLNTGGSKLSDQELRNAILLMINENAYRWIVGLADDANFKECISLSERLESERYDLELVTRFVLFRSLDEKELRSVGDLGEFLTDRIAELAQSDSFDEISSTEERAFKFTFKQLASTLGDDSFRKYDGIKRRHVGGFSVACFEPIAMGLGYNFDKYGKGRKKLPDIIENSRSLWSNQNFLRNSGTGVRASTRVRTTIPLGRELFAP